MCMGGCGGKSPAPKSTNSYTPKARSAAKPTYRAASKSLFSSAGFGAPKVNISFSGKKK